MILGKGERIIYYTPQKIYSNIIDFFDEKKLRKPCLICIFHSRREQSIFVLFSMKIESFERTDLST